MRVIDLGDDRDAAKERFALYYSAAFGGKGADGPADTRKLAKVQDALEAVSHDEPVEGGGVKDSRRVLNEDVTEIRMDDAYCEFLKGRIFGAGITWAPAVARKVMAGFDELENAREEKPGAPTLVKDAAGD